MLSTNPFAYLRKQSGLTIKAFGDLYGFSKQTIVSIEAGTFPELSERMVISLGQACWEAGIDAREALLENYGVPSLAQAYEEWRVMDRLGCKDLLASHAPTAGTAKISPMQAFIDETVGSIQGFAKRVKVPSATLARYASGKQTVMPTSIEKALRAVDYPYIAELFTLQMAWAADKH